MKLRDKILALSIEMLQFNILFRGCMDNLMEEKSIKPRNIAEMKMLKMHLENATRLMCEAIDFAEKENGGHTYIIVTDVFGERQLIECSGKQACLDMANAFHGDDGKAYIFTTDLTVGGREESIGGTIVCENMKDAMERAENMLNKQQ